MLEDYSPGASGALRPRVARAPTSVEYLIDNINPGLEPTRLAGRPTAVISQASFEDPVHKYDAIEVTANKNFSNNWSLLASYRYAKLKGNFEGFFRATTASPTPRSRRCSTSRPTTRATPQIGAPQFGYRGDIRYQGTTLGEGVLPNDRPHQFKIYGTYAWRD